MRHNVFLFFELYIRSITRVDGYSVVAAEWKKKFGKNVVYSYNFTLFSISCKLYLLLYLVYSLIANPRISSTTFENFL